MGGRGSSFELASKNEDFLKLLNNYTNGVSVEFFENDKETKRQNEETNKIKKESNTIVYQSTDYIEETFLKENIRGINKTIDKLKKNYNFNYKYALNTNKNMNTRIQGVMGKGFNAVTIPNKKNMIIGLNLGVYQGENAKEKYISNLNKSIDVGFKASVPNNKKAYYTSVHELGHAVQHAMYKKETGNKYDGFEKYAEKMRGDIIKLAKDKYNTKTNVVSKYSTQNATEWFAETFTSLMLNGALTPLTKAINEYMKKKGETNYGRNI